ncbi:tellurite resistance/C4-dicarboxylate transporter family protein [Arthrobacter sp. NIO-1057]|uniref:tellurite resistance/C4-dicarboxylate transporter family protein n=1 Tax=Arthrobacter sp. NIO-1057 TaxID=993071 RepID=UPI00071C5A71|nr:tellurite resistance/C4-dicarboxylate transporter family protein [Arthrobacter sp. NIO-1057]KSU64965.1 tellurite resistance protein permease [Arthrobacter sp. NIO-1057]SCC50000.1 Tellurite resistance protein TehA [Arthrobacter sp. NIO-1057]
MDDRQTQQEPATSRPRVFRDVLENLSPGYFALTMGTGIVSIGLHEAGWDLISSVLLVIAAMSYVVLWVLYIWRAIAFSEVMKAELRRPEMAFGYFTVVAGTDVLAVRLDAEGYSALSMVLVALAAVLWFIFGYVLPWQVFLTRDGKPIQSRVNGTWFIWAVASQSLAIGLSVVQSHLPQGESLIGLLAVLSWSVGVALYAGIAMLVLLRIVHFGMTPKEFEPPYWVIMGAMAIAVVAGSKIVGMESTPMVDATRALIAGTVAAFWSYCLWLIPFLVGAGVWRHFVHRVPVAYTPALWSIVFPVGMFAVASINLGRVDSLPIVESIGHGTLIVAVLVWAVVFFAMIRHYVLLAWRSRTRG